MELIFPTMEHKQAALEFRQEHIDYKETHIHGSSGFLKASDYEGWLDKITNARTMVPTGLVNASTYFAVVEGRIVGTVQVRHALNEELYNANGHIGYNVRPSERRKGYGTRMLALALERCRELGIDKVLVTCDKDNVISAKTIMKNGGVFENEFVEEDGNIIRRYWVTMT